MGFSQSTFTAMSFQQCRFHHPNPHQALNHIPSNLSTPIYTIDPVYISWRHTRPRDQGWCRCRRMLQVIEGMSKDHLSTRLSWDRDESTVIVQWGNSGDDMAVIGRGRGREGLVIGDIILAGKGRFIHCDDWCTLNLLYSALLFGRKHSSDHGLHLKVERRYLIVFWSFGMGTMSYECFLGCHLDTKDTIIMINRGSKSNLLPSLLH